MVVAVEVSPSKAAAPSTAQLLTDDETERESVQTGESREPSEELQQDLAHLSLAHLQSLVHDTR